MRFSLWLENDEPRFASWNSFGDLVVYIGSAKYIYFIKNKDIAQRAYAAGQHNPWGIINKLKTAGYEFEKM